MNETIRDKLFSYGVYAAAAYLRNEYINRSGVPTKKRPIDKRVENAELDVWAEAVWVANNHAYTNHHWRMLLVEAAQEKESQRESSNERT